MIYYLLITLDYEYLLPEMWILLEKDMLILESFRQTQILIDVLLATTPYDHVTLLQWDHLVIYCFYNSLLCTFIH